MKCINRRRFLKATTAAATFAGASTSRGAQSKGRRELEMAFNVRTPGVVDINTELGNGPEDTNHKKLKANLELALDHGVQPGSSYELIAAPGLNGLDFSQALDARTREWYRDAGSIISDKGLDTGLITFIGADTNAHFASPNDDLSQRGLDFIYKFIDIGGEAKASSVVGPGIAYEHGPRDSTAMYRRWDDHIGDIITRAKDKGVLYVPEHLRGQESSALLDVHTYQEFVKAKGFERFKMHLDTAHLREQYGESYLDILRAAIEADAVAHIHISEWGPWKTPQNRGIIAENSTVGRDLLPLFIMLHQTGYKGTIGVEVPRYEFHTGVGREIAGLNHLVGNDPSDVLGHMAREEQKLSVAYVMSRYNEAKQLVTGK